MQALHQTLDGSSHQAELNNPLPTGVLYYVAATWDASTDKWFLYLDGNPNPMGYLNDIGALTNDGSVAIGRDVLYDLWYFSGAIDDIRIYNRALSEAEIQQLYTSP